MKLPKDIERRCLELAGASKPRTAARPPKKLASGWLVEVELPCRVYSVLNSRLHHMERHRRAKVQADTLRVCLLRAGLGGWRVPMPVVVTWTHRGRVMDGHDNLRAAFKALSDDLSKWLGLDDSDDRIEWRYEQRPGAGGVTVRIEGA